MEERILKGIVVGLVVLSFSVINCKISRGIIAPLPGLALQPQKQDKRVENKNIYIIERDHSLPPHGWIANIHKNKNKKEQKQNTYIETGGGAEPIDGYYGPTQELIEASQLVSDSSSSKLSPELRNLGNTTIFVQIDRPRNTKILHKLSEYGRLSTGSKIIWSGDKSKECDIIQINVPMEKVDDIAKLDFVQYVTTNTAKLPALSETKLPESKSPYSKLSPELSTKVTIQIDRARNSEILNTLSKYGILSQGSKIIYSENKDKGSDILQITIPKSNILDLAKLDFVQYVTTTPAFLSENKLSFKKAKSTYFKLSPKLQKDMYVTISIQINKPRSRKILSKLSNYGILSQGSKIIYSGNKNKEFDILQLTVPKINLDNLAKLDFVQYITTLENLDFLPAYREF